MELREADYQSPHWLWIPAPPPSLPPIEFAKFYRVDLVSAMFGGKAWGKRKRVPWHIMIQYNDGRGAAMCGTVGYLDGSVVTISDYEFELGDYKRHACVDCCDRYQAKVPAHHVLFESRPLVTFEDRRI